MFINEVFNAIDLFEGKNFNESKRVSIPVKSDLSFYICKTLNNAYNLLFDSPGTFKVVNLKNKSDGISLKKFKHQNCIGDKVNPKFLDALRKSTLCYFKYLASNWKVASSKNTKSFIDECKEYFNCSDKELIVLVKEQEKRMRGDNEVYRDIAKMQGYLDYEKGLKVYSQGVACVRGSRGKEELYSKIYLGGKLEDLQQFLEIIRYGTVEKPLSLTKLMLKHISSNLELYQNDEKFKYLPEELLERIKEEDSFRIKKHTSLNEPD